MEDEEKSMWNGGGMRSLDCTARERSESERTEDAFSNKEQDNDNCVIGCVMPISTRPR